MFILAAILLHHVLKIYSPASQKRVSQSCLAIPGLSFNHNAVNVRKTCQYQLDHYLLNRTDIVIWHDAVNNSISRHRSNNFNALTPNQLKKILLNYKRNIYAIVYCKRVGTEDIYSYFTILRRYSKNLKYIISKKYTPKPGKRKRQANRNRRNAEQHLGVK